MPKEDRSDWVAVEPEFGAVATEIPKAKTGKCELPGGAFLRDGLSEAFFGCLTLYGSLLPL